MNSDYEPWVGKLEDGTEILVSLTQNGMTGAVATVEVATRAKRQHTWGPPVQLERAP